MNTPRQSVLVIDDTPFNIQILNQVLQDEVEVFFATNGSEGIALARRKLPDLILLDIMMPEMDGYEVCTALKGAEETRNIPIIFITAMGREEDERKGLDMGAIDYLTKPINPPIVRARVRNHLELKRHRDALEQLTQDLGEKNRVLEDELSLAHKVLDNILPQRLEIPGFTTSIIFHPTNRIGGDFFDGWSDDSTAHFLIGDISGHSISAALLMAVSKGIFLSLGQKMRDPQAIVTAANRMLCGMMLESQMFLTLVYVVMDRQTEVISVVSAGHNPVYLLQGETVTVIESTGPALGWDPEDRWETSEYPFPSGSLLFLHTDGLVEARNGAGDDFGAGLLPKLTGVPEATELTRLLFEESRLFCGGSFDDDVTLFAIGRNDATV